MSFTSRYLRATVALSALVFATLVGPSSPADAQTVLVGGQPLAMSPGPIERSGRIFVPLRAIFERLGASVVYSAGEINATRGSSTVSLRIGSTQASVNGQPQIVDVAPFIVGATTYVPLRFVAQSFGAEVNYNASTQVVSISAPGLPPPHPVRPPYPPPAPPPPPARMVQLTTQQPPPGAQVANRLPVISAIFSRNVYANTVRVRLDGNVLNTRLEISHTGFSYQPPAALDFGTHTVRVTGNDLLGVPFDRAWSFTVINTGPPPGIPGLRSQQPAPGSKVSNRFATISAQFTIEVNASSVRIRLDGNDITSRAGVSRTGFSYGPPAPLDYGEHTVRVTGRSLAAIAFDRTWSFAVIRSGPPQPHLTINQPGENQVVGANFVVQGNTAGNARVQVTVGPAGAPVGLFGGNTVAGPGGNFKINVSFSPLPGLQAITMKITATDPVT
ncbi:MAG: copper amine oxidase N-terminal domain-containing protein, partial [Candidatus Eremiobacteraeota bacterium]|nr:copper amine oxidase N-terminal domain-containing protein [Candidatus Eremiobacteraeota bacterium]